MLVSTAAGEPEPLIVRVLRAKVRARNVATFEALFRGQVELIRSQPGLEYVKLARQVQPDGGEELVLFEEWLDAAALYAWVGPNLAEPRLVDGARELIDELNVSHYESLDGDTVPVSEPEQFRFDDFPDGGDEASRSA